jgi:hypothetical protein
VAQFVMEQVSPWSADDRVALQRALEPLAWRRGSGACRSWAGVLAALAGHSRLWRLAFTLAVVRTSCRDRCVALQSSCLPTEIRAGVAIAALDGVCNV